MSTSALALRVNRQLLRAIGDTLDGVKIAICVFDDEDRSVFWNRTFLEVFPEHVGKVYEGEPYRKNLQRFYTARLSPADLPNIEQFISMGIDRHHTQMRPYSFDHHDQRVHVSSLPLPSGQRVRIWNTEKRHHRELPTQALATNAVVVSEETATLLDRLADGVMICDHDGMLKWVNQAFVDMYACRDKQECLNHSFFYIYEKAWQQEQTPSTHTAKSTTADLTEQFNFSGAPFDITLPNHRTVRVITQKNLHQDTIYTHVDVSELVLQKTLLLQAQAQLTELAKKKSAYLEEQMLSTLNAIALARDNETGQHILRTQHYVKTIALRLRALGHYLEELNDTDIDTMFKAAPLHDIGKVGIPDNILLKPGRLNEDEWAIMKTHALIGENTLAATKHDKEQSHLLSVAKNIAGGHHEWWNGEGYPRGLQGQQIPLEARIMAIADVYDALVSERVYKKNWAHHEAVQFILEKKKIQFDPLVVDAFLCESDTCNQIAQTFRD
jgi:response regulator RpfG family c-di-GMP phosphodiesterase